MGKATLNGAILPARDFQHEHDNAGKLHGEFYLPGLAKVETRGLGGVINSTFALGPTEGSQKEISILGQPITVETTYGGRAVTVQAKVVAVSGERVEWEGEMS